MLADLGVIDLVETTGGDSVYKVQQTVSKCWPNCGAERI